MKTEVKTSVTINGVEYIPKSEAYVKSYASKGDIKIVILQRGWVMVGRFEKNGDDCKLHSASVIRVWGTSKGLGELAQLGPLKDTKLDKTNGLVEFDKLTVVAMITCDQSVWSSYV